MPDDARLKIARGLAVIGSTTIDLNLIDGRRFSKPGGVTTYAGITYRRHDLATWAVTNVAIEDRAIFDRLAGEGIRIVSGASDETTRFINRVDAGRRVQQLPARAAAITPAQVQSALAHVDAVHLGPLHPGDIDPAVYRELSRSPLLVILDVQGLVRSGGRDRLTAGVADSLGEALTAAHIVKSDVQELHAITECYGSDLAKLIKDFAIREWLVTDGDQGGFVRDAHGTVHPYTAAEISAPQDPTGAGDVFLAAYVWARFSLGQAIPAAVRHAARKSAAQVAGRYIVLPELTSELQLIDKEPLEV
jgi:sugar/nucleoside kinase (ribokinase family)